MTRKMSAKRYCETLYEEMWEAIKNRETQSSMSTGKEWIFDAEAFLQRFGKPIRTAFKEAGLNFRNEMDRLVVLVVLASAVYRGRGPGQPKRWSRRRLQRLRSDVARIQAKYPKEKELACCKRLKKESGKRRYDLNPRTLLRQLQTAKRLEKDAELIASTRDGAVVTDLTNVLNKTD